MLSLGSADSVEQIRDALAVGCVRGHPRLTAAYGPRTSPGRLPRSSGIEAESGCEFDLVIVGNDSADIGDFQVGVRLAYALGRPVLTGISHVEVTDGTAVAKGKGPEGIEVFEIPLPAVIAVQEGGIEPRYPTIPGRMKAKRATIDTVNAVSACGRRPRPARASPAQPSLVEILGEGSGAAPAVVDLLYRRGWSPNERTHSGSRRDRHAGGGRHLSRR